MSGGRQAKAGTVHGRVQILDTPIGSRKSSSYEDELSDVSPNTRSRRRLYVSDIRSSLPIVEGWNISVLVRPRRERMGMMPLLIFFRDQHRDASMANGKGAQHSRRTQTWSMSNGGLRRFIEKEYGRENAPRLLMAQNLLRTSEDEQLKVRSIYVKSHPRISAFVYRHRTGLPF